MSGPEFVLAGFVAALLPAYAVSCFVWRRFMRDVYEHGYALGLEHGFERRRYHGSAVDAAYREALKEIRGAR